MTMNAGRFLQVIADATGKRTGYLMACPGCGNNHGIWIGAPGQGWTFDGNLEAPTFSPSLLTRTEYKDGRPEARCHAFVRNGRWEFLSDSTHALSGQTVPMIPVDGEQP